MFGIRQATEADLKRSRQAASSSILNGCNTDEFSHFLPGGVGGNLMAEPVTLRPPQLLVASASWPVSSPPSPSPPCDVDEDDEDDDDLLNNSFADNSGFGEGNLVIAEEDFRSSSQQSNASVISNAASSSATATETPLQNVIKVDLESVKKGQTLKFAIPGSSKSISLNLSVDTLREMADSVTRLQQHQTEPAEVAEVSSSTRDQDEEEEEDPKPPKGHLRMKRIGKKGKSSSLTSKNSFPCQQCSKSFGSRRQLERHLAFHVEVRLA
jgi:hypothetical protein